MTLDCVCKGLLKSEEKIFCERHAKCLSSAFFFSFPTLEEKLHSVATIKYYNSNPDPLLRRIGTKAQASHPEQGIFSPHHRQ